MEREDGIDETIQDAAVFCAVAERGGEKGLGISVNQPGGGESNVSLKKLTN